MGGAGRCCLQVAPGRDWPLRLERPQESLRCGAQGGRNLQRDSCPGSMGKGCCGSGCRACRGPDVIPPAEGGNLGSETKRHQTAARPQISSSQARRASPPPAGRPLPSSPGPGAGGWGTQQQASCPPSPAPRRNALGVKLMRKQRLPSQRPGNPAMERPPVPHPGPLPLPAFRNSSRGSPFTRLPCVRRDEEMPCGCVVSCPSSPNPAWTHLVRLPRRVGERGVRGPQPQAALALPLAPQDPEQEGLPPGAGQPTGYQAGAGHSLEGPPAQLWVQQGPHVRPCHLASHGPPGLSGRSRGPGSRCRSISPCAPALESPTQAAPVLYYQRLPPRPLEHGDSPCRRESKHHCCCYTNRANEARRG